MHYIKTCGLNICYNTITTNNIELQDAGFGIDVITLFKIKD